jgi:aminomethyltransferase
MKLTVLHPEHDALGASFTDFGGWDMPVRYGSDLAEHHAVRNSAGLFDISHMAEIRVTGPQAAEFLDFALVNPSSAIAITKAKYSLICAPDGGVIDDLIVYRLGEEEFMVVANAGNRENVVEALNERVAGFGGHAAFTGATVVDESDDWALIALQGPNSAGILQSVCDQPLADVKYYSILAAKVGGIDVLLGRTGYTGEDGFEVFTPADKAREMWQLLLAAGGEDVTPCGLASRDTLRLEAGMPLYGQELDRDHNPYEAGFNKVVRLDREGDFVGRAALTEIAAKPVARKLVSLVGEGKRAARHGYQIFEVGGTESIGEITSGALSPTLGYPIAMAYVKTSANIEVGSVLEVDIRGNRQEFTVSAAPFYKRAK